MIFTPHFKMGCRIWRNIFSTVESRKRKRDRWLLEKSVSERIEILNAALDGVLKDIELAIKIRAVYERVANSEDVIEAFNKTEEAHPFNLLRDSLYENLILILIRIFDSPSPDTASLQTIEIIFSDSEVFKSLREGFMESILSKETHFLNLGRQSQEMAELMARQAREKRAPVVAQKNIETLTKALELLKRLKGDHRLRALKGFRHRFIAHSSLKTGDIPLPKYGYAERVLDFTIPVVSELCLGLQGLNCAFEETQEIWNGYADKFWRRSIS